MTHDTFNDTPYRQSTTIDTKNVLNKTHLIGIKALIHEGQQRLISVQIFCRVAVALVGGQVTIPQRVDGVAHLDGLEVANLFA